MTHTRQQEMSESSLPSWEELLTQLRMRLVDTYDRPLMDCAVPEHLLNDSGLTEATYSAMKEKAEALDWLEAHFVNIDAAPHPDGYADIGVWGDRQQHVGNYTAPTLMEAITKAKE